MCGAEPTPLVQAKVGQLGRSGEKKYNYNSVWEMDASLPQAAATGMLLQDSLLGPVGAQEAVLELKIPVNDHGLTNMVQVGQRRGNVHAPAEGVRCIVEGGATMKGPNGMQLEKGAI